MADNDQQNDEYQFSELDALTPEMASENQEAAPTGPEHKRGSAWSMFQTILQNEVWRKAIIVVSIVILLMVVYKIYESFSSEKKAPVKAPLPAVISTPQQPKPTVLPPPAPPKATAEMDEKLSSLESAQQNMQSEITNVNNQLGGINTNVNTMLTKINELNGIITNLSTKLDEQSREIEQLTIHQRALKSAQRIRPAPKVVIYPKYYLQAVIPGRAWLIATNGATLTVREGTIIAGYGMVKLIDPSEGRVVTSSGQVIRFSQQDS